MSATQECTYQVDKYTSFCFKPNAAQTVIAVVDNTLSGCCKQSLDNTSQTKNDKDKLDIFRHFVKHLGRGSIL